MNTKTRLLPAQWLKTWASWPLLPESLGLASGKRRRSSPSSLPAARASVLQPAESEETGFDAGWYESSRALARGLRVTEWGGAGVGRARTAR